MMRRLILASASPRRKELLNRAGYRFDVCPSDADETLPVGCGAKEAVALLAQKKAASVAARFPGAVVLGCDTVVALDNVILGKPQNEADAAAMLRRLSGRVHTVWSGVCITDGARTETFCEATAVEFFPLSDETVASYLATGEPFDKAGAYGIQGFGGVLVRRFDGDYCNVVGLPLAQCARVLASFDVFGTVKI
ncbi:MAG: septum formation inhibitor Maf [Clostridia bacterium]|nr:septum formation inhibitor Maf [Clostridia bacterium]